MAIEFVPRRGLVLICDYELGRVPPEMNKARRVVVVSPRSYNRRHGMGPGRCLVVPFTATHPKFMTPATVSFPRGSYQSFTKDSWALCDFVTTVSHTRLRRVWTAPGKALDESLSDADMKRLDEGLRHAVGVAKGNE
jgi:uncharacterized protein YifN (PemK superfamily)